MTDPRDVLSGESGIVEGPRRRALGRVRDLADDTAAWLRLEPPRLAAAARRATPRRIHVVGVYGPDGERSMASSVAELRRSRHELTIVLGALGSPFAQLRAETRLEGLAGQGKFENLNALLAAEPPRQADWVIALDDDAELPRDFLNRFVFVAERFGLQLAQPAQRHTSHAAWRVVRRARWSVARRTRLVEIGPVTAFHSSVASELLPFPPLRMGWGLDAHWGGLALERGWRLGVVDATPIRHEARRTASGYDREAAVAELAEFLRDRPHVQRDTALEVVERYRSLQAGPEGRSEDDGPDH
jgi:hypothetical protein